MSAVLLPLPLGEGWGEGQPRAEEPSAKYLVQLEPPVVRAFDLLATAPDGVAKLREFIFSLAVQGKLVAQDPLEGSGRHLRMEIDSCKAKLEATGAVTRGKPLSPTLEENVPFEIPDNWEWVRLGQITNFGSTIKGESIADSTWVLDLEDIEKDTSKLLNRATFADRRSLSDKNLFQTGDVLYGKLRPYLNKVIVADREGVCTTEILPFRCFGPYEPQYFRIALQSPYFLAYVNGKSYGMKMPRLGTEDGRHALIPLPPLAEQARIVARVEELMKLCDALEANGRLEAEQHQRLTSTLLDALAASESAHALAENWQRIAQHFDLLLDRPEAIDALEQTILQLAVRGLLVPQDANEGSGDELLQRHISATGFVRARAAKALEPMGPDDVPFSVPANWAWARFGEVTDVSGGVTLGRKGALAKPVTLPYLRVANVQRGHLNLHDNLKTVTIDATEQPRFALETGDLLITEGGDWDKVGRTCIWRNEVENCLHQNHVFKARGRSSEWLPEWGELYLNSQDARAYFAASAKQTTNLASINMTELRHCAFPLPPLPEQHRIVARVQQLRALCAQLRDRLQQAQRTQGLLADALVQQAA